MAELPSTSLRLWIYPGSSSIVPHIMLEEIAVHYKVEKVDVGKAGISEEFRYINPKMRVPVLAIGDEVITELPAIATAIAHLAPAQNLHLMGRTTLEQVRIHEWLNWLTGAVQGQAFGLVVRPERFCDDVATHEALRSKGREKLHGHFAEIEQRLDGIHALGNTLTVPDLYLFVIYRWSAAQGMDMRSLYPKYTALVEAVAKRPAVQAVVANEGIKLLGFPAEKPSGENV